MNKFTFYSIFKYAYFFIVIFVFYMDVNFAEIFFPNLYSWKELMISYEGGFIRRGLLGQIFFLMDDFIPISFLAPLLFFIAFITIINIVLDLLKSLKVPLPLIVAIMFSPLLFIFNLRFNVQFMRKEIVTYVALLILSFVIIKFKLNTIVKTLLLIVTFTIATLVYETVFVWLPFICFMLCFKKETDREFIGYFRFRYSLILTIMLLVLWGCITLPFKGNEEQALLIYQSWYQKYKGLKLDGVDPFYFIAIASNTSKVIDTLKEYLSNYKLWISTFVALLYGLLPFVYIIKTQIVSIKKELVIHNERLTLVIMLFTIISPLSLCLVGFTFGRWVSFCIFTALFLLCFCFDINKEYIYEKKSKVYKTCMWLVSLVYINLIGVSFYYYDNEGGSIIYWFNFKYIYQQLATNSFNPFI